MGGRAYSYAHPALEEVVDSQHVLLGCCTNLIDFAKEAGLAGKVRWYDEQTFLVPGEAGELGEGPQVEHNCAERIACAACSMRGSFARASMLGPDG